MSKSGDTTTTSSSSTLPEWYSPYAKDMLAKAKDVTEEPYQAYSGQRLADFSPDTNAAFGLIRSNANGGAPALDAGINAATGAAKSGVIAAVVSAPVAGQVQPIPLAVGDTGIRSVTSAVNSATWTSGSFGITLAKPICDISVGLAGPATIYDWALHPWAIFAVVGLGLAVFAYNFFSKINSLCVYFCAAHHPQIFAFRALGQGQTQAFF